VVVLAVRSVYDLPTILICLLSLAILFRWKYPSQFLSRVLPLPVALTPRVKTQMSLVSAWRHDPQNR